MIWAPRELLRRGRQAAYMFKRLVVDGEVQRFAPRGGQACDLTAPADQGWLEDVADGQVKGWCRPVDGDGRTCRVDIYLDDIFLSRETCALPRPDLRALNFGQGAYGFTFRLPGEGHVAEGVVRVFGAGSGIELRGSPMTLSPSLVNLCADDRRTLAKICMDYAPYGGAGSLIGLAEAYGSRLDCLAGIEPTFADAGFPVSRAMAYVNARFHKGAFSVYGRSAYYRLLMIAADHFRTSRAGLPINGAQVERLAESTGWLLPGRLHSTVLLDMFISEHGVCLPRDDIEAGNLLARFCLEVLVSRRLPLDLLGPDLQKFLATSSVSKSGMARFTRSFAAVGPFGGRLIASSKQKDLVNAAAVSLGLGPLTGTEIATARLGFRPTTAHAGVSLIGPGGKQKDGLGMNAERSFSALNRLGIDVQALAVALDDRGSGMADRLAEIDREILLLHVQPDDAVEIIVRLPPSSKDSRLIGFFMWETERLPLAHQLGALLMDEIWTGSRYCAQVLRDAAPSTTVSVVGHAVEETEPSLDFNARLLAGAEKDDFLFYFHFDARSWITRKNPAALVRAFLRAFPTGSEPVHLLIKIRRGAGDGSLEQASWWSEFFEESAQDQRIKVIDGDFSASQMAALLQAADAFVSLHRSEGFGYAVAEAMLAGKPVVVSDYSGVQDFVGPGEGLLVPVHRRRVQIGEFLYGDPAQLWADPDIEAAARALLRLTSEPSLAQTLGWNGQQRVRRECSTNALARRYAERLAVVAPTSSPFTSARRNQTFWSTSVLNTHHLRLPHRSITLDFDDQEGRDFIAGLLRNGGIGAYEPPALPLFGVLSTLASGAVLDVGANTGLYSLVAAAANPAIDVFAFEPIHAIADGMRVNLEANTAIASRIQLVETALSNRCGESVFYETVNNIGLIATSSSLDREHAVSQGEFLERIVPVDTLSNWVNCKGISKVSLIKIDVEGHESAVLEGAKYVLERDRPFVLVEMLQRADFSSIQSIIHDFRYQDFTPDIR